MLQIKNLHARIAEDGTEILRGVDLSIPKGEVHAIMGPNGSGKSTLSYVIAGKEEYEVTEGEILLDGENILEMDPHERANAGLFLAFFSGGEKKRNEIMQMALLEPKMGILDETDSGLDIDALKVVAEGVNALRGPDRGFLVITHYQRLLDHIVPDHVHVLSAGKIVKSGDKSLALELEAKGYADIIADAA